MRAGDADGAGQPGAARGSPARWGPSPLVTAAVLAAMVALAVAGIALLIAAGLGCCGMRMPWGPMMGHMGGGGTSRAAPEPSPEARELRIAGLDFAFQPEEVRVPAGETVTILFVNEGRAVHTFTVRELDFDLQAAAGESIAGGLRVDRPGTYRVICTIRGHVRAGMVGTLTVT